MSIKILFFEGGTLAMTILTIELILLLLAAWKAPAWVKEIGLIALATTVLDTFDSIYHVCDAIQVAGVMGKLRKLQNGQTREPPKKYFDSS